MAFPSCHVFRKEISLQRALVVLLINTILANPLKNTFA
jgi:hypothetical protein